MTEQELCWLAGWLEGEGTFFCQKARPRNGVRLIIQAFSVDEDVIQKAAEIMGANIYNIKPRECRGTQWKSQGGKRLDLQAEAAAVVMKAILPFMCERRKAQIEKALHSWDQRSNKPTEKLCVCGCGQNVFGGPRIMYASRTTSACATRAYRKRQASASITPGAITLNYRVTR
jgi:hypothetical protein